MLLMAQPDAELGSRLLELRLYIDQLELEFSQLAAEFEKSKHWERNGATSAIDWMRFHCHMMSNAAADRIAVGDRSDEMLESTQALRAGDIGVRPPDGDGAHGQRGRGILRRGEAAPAGSRQLAGQVPLPVPPLPTLGQLQAV